MPNFEAMVYILALSFLIAFGCALGLSYFTVQDERQLKEGKITTEEYCQSYKTSREPPAVCWDYFNSNK